MDIIDIIVIGVFVVFAIYMRMAFGVISGIGIGVTVTNLFALSVIIEMILILFALVLTVVRG